MRKTLIYLFITTLSIFSTHTLAKKDDGVNISESGLENVSGSRNCRDSNGTQYSNLSSLKHYENGIEYVISCDWQGVFNQDGWVVEKVNNSLYNTEPSEKYGCRDKQGRIYAEGAKTKRDDSGFVYQCVKSDGLYFFTVI